MPLRDHFHLPVSTRIRWSPFHGQWPAMIVLALERILPPNYFACPTVRMGAGIEIDIATYEQHSSSRDDHSTNESGGTATALWTNTTPTMSVTTEFPDPDEFEVLIYDEERNQQLVAAIEIVSPSNKDRPESRREFVAKCAALLRQEVSVSIVDLVTTRNFNLYADLQDFFGQADPQFNSSSPSLYAVTCTGRRTGTNWCLNSWAYPMAIGQPIPSLPIWLNGDFALNLDLETTYEQTCRALRIA